MKIILVPTDFSQNSKAGIRFAIRAAGKAPLQLIFFHSVSQFLTSMISSEAAVIPQPPDLKKQTEKLKKFIFSIYRSMNLRPPANIKFIIESPTFVAESIMFTAEKLKADLIIISTHGAGGLEKIIGTNTGDLITKSAVPVLAIPKKYRHRSLEEMAYASDLSNLKHELTLLASFAKLFNVRIKVLHLDYFKGAMLPETEKTFQSVTSKIPYKKISFQSIPATINSTLIKQIEKYISHERKIMLAMFTEQNRTFLEKIFLSSKTESLSITIKKTKLSKKKIIL